MYRPTVYAPHAACASFSSFLVARCRSMMGIAGFGGFGRVRYHRRHRQPQPRSRGACFGAGMRADGCRADVGHVCAAVLCSCFLEAPGAVQICHTVHLDTWQARCTGCWRDQGVKVEAAGWDGGGAVCSKGQGRLFQRSAIVHVHSTIPCDSRLTSVSVA